MVPLWAAALGMIGTLAGAWVTHMATNRREARKWAQERRQRVTDAQTAALMEALRACNKWYDELAHLALQRINPKLPGPDITPLRELELAASNSSASVELVCSDEAVRATKSATCALAGQNWSLIVAVKAADTNEVVGPDLGVQIALGTKETADAMQELRRAYQAEMTKLVHEVGRIAVSSRSSRMRLRRAGWRTHA